MYMYLYQIQSDILIVFYCWFIILWPHKAGCPLEADSTVCYSGLSPRADIDVHVLPHR